MKINRKQKSLIKIFVALLFLAVGIINWNEISWLFNYRWASSTVNDFFYPYQDKQEAFAVTTQTVTTQNVKNAEIAYPASNKGNSLEIPDLELMAPVIVSKSVNKELIEADLDKGVVYYPGSALPGEKGQTIFLGHSAPPNWPDINYDDVFSKINDLQLGDEVVVNFNKKQFTYLIKGKKIINKGQEIDLGALDKDKNVLVLVSCWPPGKNYQRIAVYAELKT